MDIVKKEFLEGVKLAVEFKEGKLVISAEAGVAGLVQLADDKIENPIISALLQGLKAVVQKI